MSLFEPKKRQKTQVNQGQNGFEIHVFLVNSCVVLSDRVFFYWGILGAIQIKFYSSAGPCVSRTSHINQKMQRKITHIFFVTFSLYL